MFEKKLSFVDLQISPEDVYEQMGYGKGTPDERTVSGVARLLAESSMVASPRYCFTVVRGTIEDSVLNMGGMSFHLGRIISRQLTGSEAFAVFLATAGKEFELWRKKEDLLEEFITDAIGSVIAERCADKMTVALQASVDKLGWRLTNRFSPGYCQWHVSEQQFLISMFGESNPCWVVLSDSSLMWPIKSVSGLIGLGHEVSFCDYPCRLCQQSHCFKRKQGRKNNGKHL